MKKDINTGRCIVVGMPKGYQGRETYFCTTSFASQHPELTDEELIEEYEKLHPTTWVVVVAATQKIAQTIVYRLMRNTVIDRHSKITHKNKSDRQWWVEKEEAAYD